jgi:hypothetical protein
MAEGGTIASLGSADERVVGVVVLWNSVHGRETGIGGSKFKECRHVMSIEKKKLLPR